MFWLFEKAKTFRTEKTFRSCSKNGASVTSPFLCGTRVQISDYQLDLQKHFSRSPFHGHRVYQFELTSPSLHAKG